MIEICLNRKFQTLQTAPHFEKALCFGGSPGEEVSTSATFQKPSQNHCKAAKRAVYFTTCGSGSIWKFAANFREEIQEYFQKVSFCDDLFLLRLKLGGKWGYFSAFVEQGAFDVDLNLFSSSHMARVRGACTSQSYQQEPVTGANNNVNLFFCKVIRKT